MIAKHIHIFWFGKSEKSDDIKKFNSTLDILKNLVIKFLSGQKIIMMFIRMILQLFVTTIRNGHIYQIMLV